MMTNTAIFSPPPSTSQMALPDDLATVLSQNYPLASVSTVNNPDGSKDIWVWDSNNKYAFTSMDFHKNSLDQLTLETDNWDGGVKSVTEYDYNHQSDWEHTRYVFSPSGEVESYHYYLDNGSHDDVYFDWDNEDSHAWRDYHYDYWTQFGGHLQYMMTVYDDGTKQTEWY